MVKEIEMDCMGNLAIIQARTGSTRLSNKVLMELQGKTVLEHVINRVKKSNSIDEVVVATTISQNDLAIVRLCSNWGIRVFAGSEDDVLDRYYQMAKLLRPENVIRITADCPLIDAQIIDKVVQEHMQGDFDYTSNTLDETYPDGEDVEIMKFSALESAWKEARMASQREHVTQYMIHSEKYKKHSVINEINLGNKRWTLDTQNDWNFIEKVYEHLYLSNEYFGITDILRVLEKQPDIERINSDSVRNEGLIKSLESDHEMRDF